MQSFLIICAICLQLYNLTNHDPEVIKQRDLACNQCLASLNQPSQPETPTIEEIPPSETIQKQESSSHEEECETPVMRTEENTLVPVEELEEHKELQHIEPMTIEEDPLDLKSKPLYKDFDAMINDIQRFLKSKTETLFRDLKRLVRHEKPPRVSRYITSLLSEEAGRVIDAYLRKCDRDARTLIANLGSPKDRYIQSDIRQAISSNILELITRHVKNLRKLIEGDDLERLMELVKRGDLPKFEDTLKIHQVMIPSESRLISENGLYYAYMLDSGVIRVTDLLNRQVSDRLYLVTRNRRAGKRKIEMKVNGNLVVYDQEGIIWSSETEDWKMRADHYLKLDNDGKLVIYDSRGNVKKELI